MKKVTKIICAMVCIAVTLSLFASCAQKLPENFDKDKITDASKYVVEHLSARDYAAVNDITRSDLREALSPEVLSGAVEQLLGSNKQLQSYKKIDIKAAKNKSTGEEYVVSVVKAEYKNKTVTYTLGFDKDMNLIMLYLR